MSSILSPWISCRFFFFQHNRNATQSTYSKIALHETKSTVDTPCTLEKELQPEDAMLQSWIDSTCQLLATVSSQSAKPMLRKLIVWHMNYNLPDKRIRSKQRFPKFQENQTYLNKKCPKLHLPKPKSTEIISLLRTSYFIQNQSFLLFHLQNLPLFLSFS